MPPRYESALDGHFKAFGLFAERGGRYGLAPLYDIRSVYPVLGRDNDRVPQDKLKPAMAFTEKNRHDKCAEM